MDAVADPLRVLQASTAAAAGLEYFQALARGFAEAFGMRFAMVGQLVPGADAVAVLAMWGGDGFVEVDRYELDGTPCAEIVRRREACQFTAGAAVCFPGDAFLTQYAIEAYIGVPLRGADGRVLGLLSALDSSSRDPIPALDACVGPFADRAAWLIERLDLEERLRREASRASALAAIAAILQYKDMSESSFDDVCALVRDTLEADVASLLITDPLRGELVRRGSDRLPEHWKDVDRTSLAEAERGLPRGDVVQLRREDLLTLPHAQQVTPEQHAAMFARARSDQQLVGLIAVVSNRPRRWLPDEEAWLAGVAGLISQALVNARLVEALRASEARFRGIVATGLEGVLTLDAAHAITFANPQAGELLGRHPAELPGLSASEFVAADRLEQLRRGGRLRFEVRLGARTVVASAASIADASGAYAGATLLLADITETRALADRVAQLEKLESLAVLAGGVAHDFNNLLAAVLGNLELARQRTPSASPAQPFLAEVDAAARRAAELTQQMLTYAGRSRPSVERLDLGHLLADLRVELRRCAGGHALQIAVAPGHAVDGDAAQLRQLVLNLFRNAVEALEGRKGAIHLELSTRTLAADAPGPVVVGDARGGTFAALAIRDNGCGIEPAIFPRIFDPFFSTKFTGRGLGLSAALGIVRAHRGSIAVTSTPGLGSTFTVLLPLADGPAPARKILVVDDDPDVLALSARVLGAAGYEVVRARSGAAALERFAEGGGAEFVAVLLDMAMPGLDGAETFARLRQIRGDVAVIFTSGYDESDIRERLDGAAPAGFLQKPWTSETLLRAVRAAAG